MTDAGVFYVLDEVHIAFNSRAWADTGAEVLYYLSQHRKLGDDVICITQAIANVDKQFRSVAQDYTYIKNLSKQRIGLFRLPALFWRHTYSQPATDTSKPMESGTFKLDVAGVASLYDTAKGVGIHGRAGADTNARKKGLSWVWFAVGLPIVLWLIMHYFPLFGAWLLRPAGSPGRPVTSLLWCLLLFLPVVCLAGRGRWLQLDADRADFRADLLKPVSIHRQPTSPLTRQRP